MLKRTLYLMVFLFTCGINKSQINLVPNPSFEDYYPSNCFVQMAISQPTSVNPYVKNWYSSSSGGTPDYFNVCANFFPGNPYPVASTVPTSCKGYQLPRTGNAFAGCGIYGISFPLDSASILVEYFSVKLPVVLKMNQCYYGEMYVSLANSSDIAINQISMYLTAPTFTTATFSFTNTIKPQIQWDTTQCFKDTVNWVKISGNFVAQGGEEFLTIGNFRDGNQLKKTFTTAWTYPSNCGIPGNPNHSYIFIDDVALYEIPTPQLSFNSITICPDADSLLLGDTAHIETSYQWFANGSLIANTSSITVKPNQTTSFVLQTTHCNTSTQTVVVTYSANCEPVVVVEPIIPNVFTPNNDSINDVWRFNLGKGNTLKALSIYNRWGNDVTPSFYQQEHIKATTVLWDGRTTAGEQTPGGVYFYMLQYTDAIGEEHKKNGYITLIR
jgi:gliding motility-associated-like protein